ncbi:response regulator transcription factor [Pedobacter sp. BMA]|uniref:response regulator transcription factor n=1 Tax=Pedobacter sp. BMA TaxID=1663685 RepID=UPI00064B5019|nr:response regulator [Pedobacter sp. BMA]KLT63978.1 hypothetical protein AB669_19865 [Pedobacter sp. BMA]
MEKKVMIIDDDRDAMKVIKDALTADGCMVESIMTIDDIYPNLQSFKPNLFILDINLKGGDGRSLCNKIKADLSYHHIPIVLLTSLDFEKIGEIDCEADAILGKPIDMKNLSLTINNLIGDLSQ